MAVVELEIIVAQHLLEPVAVAGGSGYVWTSSTASSAPSGYAVSTKYYLTNATTYAGNTSFTSFSGGTETGHSGDGCAKITIDLAIKETTTETTVTEDMWITIEERIENGTLTGTFSYNGKKITETTESDYVIVHEEV